MTGSKDAVDAGESRVTNHASRIADHDSRVTNHESRITSHESRVTNHESPFTIRHLGVVGYESVWSEMRRFTGQRTAETPDEIWLLEHPPVYTYGVAGRKEHLPQTHTGIPIVHVDRGGQVTYHGPGQLVAYTLLDLRRRGLTVRALVRALEDAVIDLLDELGIAAYRRPDAPGVYVAHGKIAALGLRIRNGCCYHGLSLNVDMDLTPFHAIDPCGYPSLQVTRLLDLGVIEPMQAVATRLASALMRRLAPMEEHA